MPELADGFTAPAFEAWEALALKSLKGRTLEALRQTTEDGVVIEPLYPVTSSSSAWTCETTPTRYAAGINLPTIAAALDVLNDERANGVSDIVLSLRGSTDLFGLAPDDAENGGPLFQACGAAARARLDYGLCDEPVARLAALAAQHGVSFHPGFDAHGYAARRGVFEHVEAQLQCQIAWLHSTHHAGPAFLLNGPNAHNAGAGAAQELAFLLAQGADVLRAFEKSGIEPATALPHLSCLVAADAQLFTSIMKIRALHALWSRFTQAIAGTAQTPHVDVDTSRRMMAAQDPHTNILRTTLASFAALLCGVQSVHIQPYTSACGLADRAARRLARNTFHILQAEAHAQRVMNAMDGAAFFAATTAQLARRAWTLFQDMERAGGLLAVLRAGTLQRDIAMERTTRAQAFKTNDKTILGVTLYPDPTPLAVSVLAPLPGADAPSPFALVLQRDAAPFETPSPHGCAA